MGSSCAKQFEDETLIVPYRRHQNQSNAKPHSSPSSPTTFSNHPQQQKQQQHQQQQQQRNNSMLSNGGGGVYPHQQQGYRGGAQRNPLQQPPVPPYYPMSSLNQAPSYASFVSDSQHNPQQNLHPLSQHSSSGGAGGVFGYAIGPQGVGSASGPPPLFSSGNNIPHPGQSVTSNPSLQFSSSHHYHHQQQQQQQQLQQHLSSVKIASSGRDFSSNQMALTGTGRDFESLSNIRGLCFDEDGEVLVMDPSPVHPASATDGNEGSGRPRSWSSQPTQQQLQMPSSLNNSQRTPTTALSGRGVGEGSGSGGRSGGSHHPHHHPHPHTHFRQRSAANSSDVFSLSSQQNPPLAVPATSSHHGSRGNSFHGSSGPSSNTPAAVASQQQQQQQQQPQHFSFRQFHVVGCAPGERPSSPQSLLQPQASQGSNRRSPNRGSSFLVAGSGIRVTASSSHQLHTVPTPSVSRDQFDWSCMSTTTPAIAGGGVSGGSVMVIGASRQSSGTDPASSSGPGSPRGGVDPATEFQQQTNAGPASPATKNRLTQRSGEEEEDDELDVNEKSAADTARPTTTTAQRWLMEDLEGLAKGAPVGGAVRSPGTPSVTANGGGGASFFAAAAQPTCPPNEAGTLLGLPTSPQAPAVLRPTGGGHYNSDASVFRQFQNEAPAAFSLSSPTTTMGRYHSAPSLQPFAPPLNITTHHHNSPALPPAASHSGGGNASMLVSPFQLLSCHQQYPINTHPPSYTNNSGSTSPSANAVVPTPTAAACEVGGASGTLVAARGGGAREADDHSVSFVVPPLPPMHVPAEMMVVVPPTYHQKVQEPAEEDVVAEGATGGLVVAGSRAEQPPLQSAFPPTPVITATAPPLYPNSVVVVGEQPTTSAGDGGGGSTGGGGSSGLVPPLPIRLQRPSFDSQLFVSPSAGGGGPGGSVTNNSIISVGGGGGGGSSSTTPRVRPTFVI